MVRCKLNHPWIRDPEQLPLTRYVPLTDPPVDIDKYDDKKMIVASLCCHADGKITTLSIFTKSEICPLFASI